MQETQRNYARNTQVNARRKKITQAKNEKCSMQHARGTCVVKCMNRPLFYFLALMQGNNQ